MKVKMSNAEDDTGGFMRLCLYMEEKRVLTYYELTGQDTVTVISFYPYLASYISI